MDLQELSTSEQVLDALGGIEAVAELTGSKPKAVTNWKYFNAFPARTFLVMTADLKKRGHHAPASLWGMREPAEAAE